MPNKREIKVCECCGQEFGCGAKLDGCWCTELTLTESAAAEIRTQFQDCVCRSCLEKFDPDPIHHKIFG